MLTEYAKSADENVPEALSANSGAPGEPQGNMAKSNMENRLAHAMRIEWLGQTAASLFWIASVLAYGITSSGDYLQLLAASSWLLANLAVLASDKAT